MRQRHTTPPAAPGRRSRHVGVGIDTSRYGHYAAFLGDDLQPAAAEIDFAESAQGYARFRGRLQQLLERHGPLHFIIRLDAAGQYAENLLHFLHALPGAPGWAQAPAVSISCGDPQRNKNYRAALYGAKKSDPIEARAAARFAAAERPAHVPLQPPALRTLRHVAGRLQAVVRQRTRLVNQFHRLLALSFPELALLVQDVAAGWVLELLPRYPTAPLPARAGADDLGAIPYLPDRHRDALPQRARSSVASQSGPVIEELVRDQVRQLRDVRARQKRLENLLVSAYGALPTPNHLGSIPGIGPVTAAVRTAIVGDIDRFAGPGKLVAYFGALPVEASSGVDRDGRPRGPQRFLMSRRGNDLVRRSLWVAALSAVRHNPAVKALDARVAAKHPGHKAVAIGHALRKLLHLVFAVWKTGQPFDPQHYPWQTAAEAPAAGAPAAPRPEADNQAAGHKRSAEPAREVVTAAWAGTGGDGEAIGERTAVDFAHRKRQLPLARVLDQLGLLPHLRGSGPQRRGACPIHRGDGRGRTFSVHLDQGVFRCFDSRCGHQGDVIDLWAGARGLSLREAALDLVRTLALEPAPCPGTEKRNG